jgi:hypothetical protein
MDSVPMNIWHDRAVFHFLTEAEDSHQQDGSPNHEPAGT